MVPITVRAARAGSGQRCKIKNMASSKIHVAVRLDAEDVAQVVKADPGVLGGGGEPAGTAE